MKVIGACKGWVKALTEDMKVDQISADDKNKQEGFHHDEHPGILALHNLKHGQSFLLYPSSTRHGIE